MIDCVPRLYWPTVFILWNILSAFTPTLCNIRVPKERPQIRHDMYSISSAAATLSVSIAENIVSRTACNYTAGRRQCALIIWQIDSSCSKAGLRTFRELVHWHWQQGQDKVQANAAACSAASTGGRSWTAGEGSYAHMLHY
jgi:hypothetical protein